MELPRGAGLFLAVTVLNGALAGILDLLCRAELLHRHWLLPSLAAGLACQWLASLLLPRPASEAAVAARASMRSALLSLLAFVTGLGVVGYPGVFACLESCAARFGYAGLLAGLVFWHQSQADEPIFWGRMRSRLAALGCGLWGAYLLLYHRQLTLWMLDIVFFILAMTLWLGRSQAVFLIASLGIVALAGLRSAGSELAVVSLDLALLTCLFFGGPWVEARLRSGPAPTKTRWTVPRIAAVALVLVVLAVFAGRPAWLMVSPEKRRARLEGLAPAFPVRDPKTLSPLAGRLRGHVVELAGRIGERSAYLVPAQKRAQEYVASEFRKAGYAPEYQEFTARRKVDFMRTEPYRNVEAVLRGRDDGRGIWVVAAHYDTAPGTPGADDNASGVAVLLETARLLREGGYAGREIRFVAFDAEEPPAFGTRDMGSLRCVDELKGRGVKIRGMINLEMVGYFNPAPGAQLFPPFLQLFYPDQGDFVGLAGNLRSLSLGRAFSRAWGAEGVRLLPATLPFVFSTLVISDQLNFWYAGIPALMLTDTAFFRNPNYHQDSDTPEKLDYERMAGQAEALVRVLSGL
ncbi:MAG: M28 family peptidase [Elusimicrobia bacterium]|nr:M28 family peptidase [Elusimicrobiota bacterium]